MITREVVNSSAFDITKLMHSKELFDYWSDKKQDVQTASIRNWLYKNPPLQSTRIYTAEDVQ